MAPSVSYHCSCLSSSSTPPPPHLPSSAFSFHPLHDLYFCEECDAVRCNRCVAVEVSIYYCPNCLFEVPSASVRAEKNRCARNCFQCPHCRNTLSVVGSDPPDMGSLASASASAAGEAPYFLYCNFCRWDSAEVDITFEKATGLALALQKSDDNAPDVVEFERLKEHFEPYLRATASGAAPPSSIAHSAANPITSAASSALLRDISIPGLNKYSSLLAGRRGAAAAPKTGKPRDREELADFRSKWECSAGAAAADAEVEWLKRLEDVGDVASVEQRWIGSWTTSIRAKDLRPLRIPLHSKKAKRCPACRHILIKPEQKAQSVRYKIKLVAANYLPAIVASLVPTSSAGAAAGPKRTGKPDDDAGGGTLLAGKTFAFTLALTNPLYDPITVRVAVHRRPVAPGTRPPFAVTLPPAAFPVAAYAEAWEYEDEDDALEDDVEELLAGARGETYTGTPASSKKKAKTVGVLERKANTTVIGGEVVIGKEGRGNVKFNMAVSYTYRSDDPAVEDGSAERSTKAKSSNAGAEMKTFSFFTVVDLGAIVPKDRDEPRRESEAIEVEH